MKLSNTAKGMTIVAVFALALTAGAHSESRRLGLLERHPEGRVLRSGHGNHRWSRAVRWC